jgi:hypothetical protein
MMRFRAKQGSGGPIVRREIKAVHSGRNEQGKRR